jgi:hypothetical protein
MTNSRLMLLKKTSFDMFLYVLFSCILGIVFTICWNYSIPYIFNLKSLTCLQGLALISLWRIISK